MAIPQNIKELANGVRSEIYGKDVRESIAKSMEATSEVAEWSRQVAQDIVDGKFDEGELATEIARKLNELETEYAPNLNSIRQDFAQSVLTASNNKPTTFRNPSRNRFVTFIDDDGNKDAFDFLFPIFKSKGVPFSCALITSWINNNNPGTMTKDQVKTLIDNGVEMLGHTHDAHSPNMTYKTEEELILDMKENRRQLALLGSTSRGFVYPQNAHNIMIRSAVQTHFDFSFGGTGVNGSGGVSNPMVIPRIGFGPWGLGADLAAYKSHVDNVANNGGWLVFMMHSGNTTPEEFAILPELIDYIKSKGIDIVNPSEAYDACGSKIFIGDMEDKFLNIRGYSLSTNFDVAVSGEFRRIWLPTNSKGAMNPITDYLIGETIIQISKSFASADGNFPVPEGGEFYTFRYDGSNHAYSRQEYRIYDSDDIYIRNATPSGGWGTWQKLATMSDVTSAVANATDIYIINSSTINTLPNSYALKRKTIEYLSASYMVNQSFPTKEASLLEIVAANNHDFVKQILTDRKNNEVYQRVGYGTTWTTAFKKLTYTTV